MAFNEELDEEFSSFLDASWGFLKRSSETDSDKFPFFAALAALLRARHEEQFVFNWLVQRWGNGRFSFDEWVSGHRLASKFADPRSTCLFLKIISHASNVLIPFQFLIFSFVRGALQSVLKFQM